MATGDAPEHGDSGSSDLGANTVTWQHDDQAFHA
jgi:hypothetical protein